MRRALVWYGQAKAGYLEETDDGYRFAYDAEYLRRETAQPVSLTLPLRTERSAGTQLERLEWKQMDQNKCLVCFENLVQGQYQPRCCRTLFDQGSPLLLDFSKNQLANLGLDMLGRRGGIPGVQTKLSLGKDPRAPKRLTIVDLRGRFVLKPPTEEFPELPENEALCMELASRLGLPVAPHGLVQLADGTGACWTQKPDGPLRPSTTLSARPWQSPRTQKKLPSLSTGKDLQSTAKTGERSRRISAFPTRYSTDCVVRSPRAPAKWKRLSATTSWPPKARTNS